MNLGPELIVSGLLFHKDMSFCQRDQTLCKEEDIGKAFHWSLDVLRIVILRSFSLLLLQGTLELNPDFPDTFDHN